MQWDRRHMEIESDLLQCLFKFVESVNELFPGRLHQAVLYGSYARGNWQDDSDVDVALIMDSISINEVVDRIVDLAVDMEYEHGFYISPIGIDTDDFNKNTFKPLYRNIRNEGIKLWEEN